MRYAIAAPYLLGLCWLVGPLGAWAGIPLAFAGVACLIIATHQAADWVRQHQLVAVPRRHALPPSTIRSLDDPDVWND